VVCLRTSQLSGRKGDPSDNALKFAEKWHLSDGLVLRVQMRWALPVFEFHSKTAFLNTKTPEAHPDH
jgi:hypothetical protein